MAGRNKFRTDTSMGDLISTNVDLDVEVLDPKKSGERIPGLGWSLSQETVEKMREIDDSIRAAEQISGSLLMG
jgi:hypothetical protein